MCTSFCPKCGGDFLNDGPVCIACLREADEARFLAPLRDRTPAERVATINRLCNLAADDDGEIFTSSLNPDLAPEGYRLAAEMNLAAMKERMAASGDDPFGERVAEIHRAFYDEPVIKRDLVDEVLTLT